MFFRQIPVIAFVLLAATINAVLYQLPLYQFVAENTELNTGFGWRVLLSVFVIVWGATAMLLLLLTSLSWRLLKPVLIVFALGNSVAVYYMHSYHVILDRAMMGNVLNTQGSEVADLLHINLLFYLFFLGVMPVVLLIKTRLRVTPWLRLKSLLATVIVALSLGAWTYAVSDTWLWFDKHAKHLGGKVLPWSYVINTVRFYRDNNRNTERILLPAIRVVNPQKTVVVLVIGETARANNFSLYGYERETNPKLKQQTISVFPNTRACTTYTTGSLACMLSHEDSVSAFGSKYEPLPSYLNRHQVEVIWRTRNWGEPPIVVNHYQKAGELEKHCTSKNCHLDEILLSGSVEQIQSAKSDKIFVVLHQRGSHGPSYFKEYPKDQAVFTPVCDSVNLQKCTQQSIVNAYDNTLLYTDDFLNQTIETLKQLDNIATTMMYVSDHGESLGEQGLYLHGTPYSLAPDYQKDVPFIVWMSPLFVKQYAVNPQQMGQAKSYGHHHIFHSVMGALGLESEIYHRQRDIFSEGK